MCLGIACKAHKGQIDKVGLPVILHPIHVGEMGNSTEEICVGFLHDTIEDTDMTYDKLLSLGVRKDIADSVCVLTHKKGVPYFDYIQSIIDSKDMVAIQVKINDLDHNLSRAKKYGFQKQYEKCTTALSMMGGGSSHMKRDNTTHRSNIFLKMYAYVLNSIRISLRILS